jgi:hypothetical protein
VIIILFAIPPGFIGIGYLEGIELYLWFGAIGLFFLGAVLFLRKAMKELRSREISYIVYIAYGIFLIGMGLTRVFFLIAFFIPDLYDFYTILGYISAISGLVFWLYVVETRLVKKTKKILTITSLIIFGISILALLGLADRYLALEIQYILMPVALGAIFILYLYLITKSTGTVRTKVVWILIGIIMVMFASVLDGEAFVTANPNFPFFIAPTIMSAGVFIFIYTQLYYKG